MLCVQIPLHRSRLHHIVFTPVPGWGEEVSLSTVCVVPVWGMVVQPQGVEVEHHAGLSVWCTSVCASVYYIIQAGGVCVRERDRESC